MALSRHDEGDGLYGVTRPETVSPKAVSEILRGAPVFPDSRKFESSSRKRESCFLIVSTTIEVWEAAMPST